MRFRKKPVVIEAIQYDGSDLCGRKINRWSMGKATPVGDQILEVQTLEGDVYAGPGDWIIKGVEGEFYPCSPTVFAKTYDAVPEVAHL